MSAFKEDELIMTKRKDENDQFKPLSAVATSITTMGINGDGEFFQETTPLEDDIELEEQAESPDHTPAEIAAEFASRFLMHRHRGVINCDSYYVIFGNDGFSEDHRSRKESHDLMRRFRGHDLKFGLSGDRHTWAIVLTDHTKTLYQEEELDHIVWDVWMEVCDELAE